MLIVKRIDEFNEAKSKLKGTIGFIPTMGALHDGHLSLIRKSIEENEFTIVSIFVNPTQFLQGEDLKSYPRREEADTRICDLAGVDILFIPAVKQMYGDDELSIGAPARRGYILDGAKRAGHFDGMLQIVMKLLNLANPTKAYFGKKDTQQLLLISQMVDSYFMDVEIMPCEIIREPSGLAMSSRNLYLNQEQKDRALALSKSLQKATQMVLSHEMDAKYIIEEMNKILIGVDSIEYIAITDRGLKQIESVVVGNTVILVAAWVGQTRLIDNIWI